MATFEKSATASPLLSSSASSFSCRSPALQQSLGAASPSLSPCPSLNASSVIVLLPDDSVRLYEQRISANRVLAEFPNHELRRAGSGRSLDTSSHLSSRETYALINPQLQLGPKPEPSHHHPTASSQQQRPPQLPLSQNESFSQLPREYSPTAPPLQRARTTSPERSHSAAPSNAIAILNDSTNSCHPVTHAPPDEPQRGRSSTRRSAASTAADTRRRCDDGNCGAAPHRVFDEIVAAPTSPYDGPFVASAGRSVGPDGRDRAQRAGAATCGETVSAAGAAADQERASERTGFGESPSRDYSPQAAENEWSEQSVAGDSCTPGDAAASAWAARRDDHFVTTAAMASPLWRQSSLTTYLPSTAGGRFLAATTGMIMHAQHAPHAPHAPAPLFPMAFPDTKAADAPLPPSQMPPPPPLDTSALLCPDSELLTHGELQFDSWIDESAADVATPRLPPHRHVPSRAEESASVDGLRGIRGTVAAGGGGQREWRGGDAARGSLPPELPQNGPNAANHGLKATASTTSGTESTRLSTGAGDGERSGADCFSASESEGGEASAAARARGGAFVRKRATSGFLDLSSSSGTNLSATHNSSGGGACGGDDSPPKTRHARAGSSLLDEWSDLGGRPPWVAGGGGAMSGKDASAKSTEKRRPIFHQKTPSGRILQELFDLENGPLDLEFLVSLRTPSRRHYDSPARSSAHSSPYARYTLTATPPRPPSSLAPAPAPGAASDGPALLGAALVSLDSAAMDCPIPRSASAGSDAPHLSPAVSAAAAASSAGSSAADDDEAAAAAASAWAAAELVDGSVSPVASASRGWIASAARSRFISRIAHSFNYSSLQGRRGLFGLRNKSTTGSSSSNGGGNGGNGMSATGSTAAAAAADSASGSGKSGSRVGGGTRLLIRRETMPMVRHEHMATALDGSSDRFSAAVAGAAIHASASDGDLSSTAHLPNAAPPVPQSSAAAVAAAAKHEAGRTLTRHGLAGSRGSTRSISIGAASSGSSTSVGAAHSSSSVGVARSSSSASGVSQANMVAWGGAPEPSLHDAAWRVLLMQQQKIAEMEAEILELRQRCCVAGLGGSGDRGTSGGGTVVMPTAVSVDGADFVLEKKHGGGASGGAVYGGLGKFTALSVRSRLRVGLEERGENTLEVGCDERENAGGSEVISVHIPSPTSSHCTPRWTARAARRPDSPVVSPRFSPRPAVAVMGAAAAAAAAAAGLASESSSAAAAGVRQGFKAF
ncbi:hypothetical protein CLOM_g23444 [Closterium sp. NIES-68]|nr:hypothetical protein CLOM_g23444 [Closterium sp. NIES-68]GJP72077.1 hypothetical protein CLOP_g2846 [Closterium sp. NIES-67]